MKYLLIPLVPFWLAACGGDAADSAGSPPAEPESTAASVSMSEAVSTAGVMMGDAVATTGQPGDDAPVEQPSKGVVTTDYEDALYGLGGAYGASPRGFLRRQIDPASEGGLMNRFNETLSDHFCLLGQLLPTTDGVIDLAPDGAVLMLDSDDLTGDAATRIESACPALAARTLAQLSEQAPLSLYYRVEDLSGLAESHYERKVSIGWNQPTYSDFTYFSVGETRLKLLVLESNKLRPGKGSSYGALETDSTSGVVRFEYHRLHLGSEADTHDVYRIYANAQTGESTLLARSNSDRTVSESMVAVARRVGDGLLEVSFDIDAAADIRDLTVCVDPVSLDPVLPEKTVPGCDAGPVVAASAFSAQAGFTFRVKPDFARLDQMSVLGFDSADQVLSAPPLN